MTTINHYLNTRALKSIAISGNIRTATSVFAAGVATGVSVYLLSLLVGSWA